MPRRTQIQAFSQIESADDLKLIVRDKRENKRASKQKQVRRNRHYTKTLLKHLADEHNAESHHSDVDLHSSVQDQSKNE